MSDRNPHRVDRWSARLLAAAPELVSHGLDRHRRAGLPVVEGTELAHRGWTRLGTIAGSSPALVDPRGLVVPRERDWSLDWWVGADDRWYYPAREGAVAQDLVDDAPVVATTLRVPGGEIVHRVGAVRHEAEDVLLVEISNEAAVPVALAIALRPYGADGPARVARITLDGTEVHVDGHLAVRLARPPARSAAGSWVDGDVVETVVAGGAGDGGALDHRDADGAATAVFILPLTHGTTQRFVLPVGRRPRVRRVGLRRRTVADALPAPDTLPPLERVVTGWRSLSDGGTRIVTPDAGLARILTASRGHLLRAAADLRIDGRPTAEAALVAEALGRLGHHDEAVEILTEVANRQRPDGSWGEDVSTEMVVSGLGGQVSRSGAPADVSDLWAAALAAGAHALVARGGGDGAVERAVAGLHRIDQAEAAGELDAQRAALSASPPDPGPAPDGFASVVAQARLADHLVAAGDPTGFELVSDLVRSASPTVTWPESERVDGVRLARGEGHSAVVQALAVHAVLDLLVHESADGLDVFPIHPGPWERAGIEIHDLPTRWGRLSAAVRWHGERPALLWSVDDPRPGLVLRSPVHGPSWSTSEASGETLLG